MNSQALLKEDAHTFMFADASTSNLIV